MYIQKAILLFLFLSFSNLCYGQINLIELYNLTDKNRLKEIIVQTEKVLKNNSSDKEALKIFGIAYHNLAILEVKDASETSERYLEKATQLSPDDYEIIAYLGSAKTMVARDSWNFFTKVQNVNKGINIIDRAVSKSPDNITVRMVRAKNSLSLPKSFNRKNIAMKDLLHIEKLLESSKGYEPDFASEVFYHIAMLYKDEGNKDLAKKYFEKAKNVSEN
jgi:tetratricopeptide (TPR) repeat protein